MEKEDIVVLAQLLTTMKDYVAELERAYKSKDSEKLAAIKKEINNLQKEIDSHL